jgi:hypothetical protein
MALRDAAGAMRLERSSSAQSCTVSLANEAHSEDLWVKSYGPTRQVHDAFPTRHLLLRLQGLHLSGAMPWRTRGCCDVADVVVAVWRIVFASPRVRASDDLSSVFFSPYLGKVVFQLLFMHVW